MGKKKKSDPWWKDGLRFECQGSGKCCVSRGQYGYVYLTKPDRAKMAKFLKLSPSVFTKKYCEKDELGQWKLREFKATCQFLQNNQCVVYEARPTQCRTWPFWPEVMGAKAWAKDVAAFCPGVGKGKLWSPKEIEKNLEIQRNDEELYGT